MENKEFLPYKMALELKELGFDEPCFGHYDLDGLQVITHHWYPENKNSSFPAPQKTNNPKISAPTFSQAFRFFREKYLIFGTIKVDQTMEPKFCYSISTYEPSQFMDGWNDDVYNSDLYYTYEEAEAACLDKLIEIVKNK